MSRDRLFAGTMPITTVEFVEQRWDEPRPDDVDGKPQYVIENMKRLDAWTAIYPQLRTQYEPAITQVFKAAWHGRYSHTEEMLVDLVRALMDDRDDFRKRTLDFAGVDPNTATLNGVTPIGTGRKP